MNSFRSLLLFSLAFSFISSAFATTFPDVSSNHGNSIAIEYLVSIGTLQGYPDGTFQPSRTINRAELMKVLVAGHGIAPDEGVYKDCFPDVKSEWFAKYVCYAAEQGWVAGYSDGTFKPAQTVNKVEALKMLVNALGLASKLPESVTSELFMDTDNLAWYAPYISVAKDLNLLEVSSGAYNPSGDMNRGGVAEYIFRTLVTTELEVEVYDDLARNSFLTINNLEDLLPSEIKTYAVDYVIDGDTIKLTNGESVRLLGVDAPESDDCYANESKAYLESLIGSSEVTLEDDAINDDRDQYERLLRYVYAGDTLVNLEMVKQGYAKYYESYPLTMSAEFGVAQEEAEENALGLWSTCENVQADSSSVYISYVFYDGEVAQVESDEYVELMNGGSTAINLEGYYIKGSSGEERYTFGDFELGSGESVRITTNAEPPTFANDRAIWANGGETVYLYDGSGTLVDSYEY